MGVVFVGVLSVGVADAGAAARRGTAIARRASAEMRRGRVMRLLVRTAYGYCSRTSYGVLRGGRERAKAQFRTREGQAHDGGARCEAGFRLGPRRATRLTPGVFGHASGADGRAKLALPRMPQRGPKNHDTGEV
ncbi:hypothetical protein Pen01_16590 [Phytomonospora endophytica]|nr:hypothetical protein Pen01_16590 [Phytomonospora endophytica]